MQGFRVLFRVHRSCPLSTYCDKKVMQSVSLSVLQQRSDHRVRKLSIVSLDILITLTLYKLASLLSGAKFWSHDQIHFQKHPRYMVCKNALFGSTFEQKKWVQPRFRLQNPSTRMHLMDMEYDMHLMKDLFIIQLGHKPLEQCCAGPTHGCISPFSYIVTRKVIPKHYM